ncbi:MAG: hypothetical protein HGB26_06195, partial [Desulfobulbaceae bacterium]|nr:hypothetical protein [Desulfobulbaceae bacterium]
KSIIIGSERVISLPCPIQKGIEMYPNIAGRGYKNRNVRETREKQIKKIGIFCSYGFPPFINPMQTMGQKPFDLYPQKSIFKKNTQPKPKYRT